MQCFPGSKKPAGGGGANNKPSSVMPVTVAMMLKADHNKADDMFNYDNVDIHMVLGIVHILRNQIIFGNFMPPPLLLFIIFGVIDHKLPPLQ